MKLPRLAEVAAIKSSRVTVHAGEEETARFTPRAALCSSFMCTPSICESMRLCCAHRIPPFRDRERERERGRERETTTTTGGQYFVMHYQCVITIPLFF
jgi:hypothetical protein